MKVHNFYLLFITAICMIWGGTSVTALKITIEEPTQQPFYAIEGKNFSIKCIVHAAPQNSLLYWYRNDVEIASTADTGFFTQNLIVGNERIGILTKQNVTREDAATYKCQEEISRSNYLINIKVSKKSFGQHKRDVNSETSNTAVDPVHATVHRPTNSCVIACEVSGDLSSGLYQIEWYKNGGKIENEEKKYKIHEKNGSLEIISVDFDKDLGEYTCTVNIDNAQTANETVYVYGMPYVLHFEKSKNLVEDDALNLTCKAYGYPTPTVTWLKDGQPINKTSDRVSYTNYKDVVNASIKITKMQFEDAGIYSCDAINEINGVAFNNTEGITVRVKDKLAALWPFLGICVEVTVLCIIIFIYERHRKKKMEEEEAKEEAGHLTNSHAKSDDVRQRKV